MKKKAYLSPTVQVYILNTVSHLLSGSEVLGATVKDGEADIDQEVLSRRRRSTWDDEEEDENEW